MIVQLLRAIGWLFTFAVFVATWAAVLVAGGSP